MIRNIQNLAFLSALIALSCSAPNDDAECDGEIELSVSSSVPDVVSGPLVFQGTAVPTRNVNIRSVNVAGVEAELSSFNFRTWTATIPFEALLALQPTDGKAPDDVEVPVAAVPACGTAASTRVPVHLNRHPEIAVSSLTLAAAFSGEHPYLPANGSASAVLTLSANPEARGATVMVRATGEGHFSGAGKLLPLVLAGDGASASMATALVNGDGAGSVFLTASSSAAFAEPLKIDTAVAPKLFPPTAELAPGQSLIVLVEKQLAAQNVSCTVHAEKGLTVTPASDMSSFTLVAADALADRVEATIECRDDYGQATSVTYTAAPEI
jgi:hypothetical protein